MPGFANPLGIVPAARTNPIEYFCGTGWDTREP
jgi:hypothetical protein